MKPGDFIHDENGFVREVNRAFYDSEAEAYDARHPEVLHGSRDLWDKRLAGPVLREMSSRDAGRDAGRDGRRVLDMGCGTGFAGDILLDHLDRNDTLACCDISTAMLACARRKLAGRGRASVGFVCADAARAPFKSDSFDVITINALLHHLADCAPVCAEAGRLLRDGGYLVVAHEPNRVFFQSPLIRVAASIYKLLGLGKSIDSGMRKRINRALKERGAIGRELSGDEILRIVEYNSPVEQSRFGVSGRKGFIPEDLAREHFPRYNMTLLETYTTAFVRPVFENVEFLGRMARTAALFLHGKGNHFCMVLKKPLSD